MQSGALLLLNDQTLVMYKRVSKLLDKLLLLVVLLTIIEIFVVLTAAYQSLPLTKYFTKPTRSCYITCKRILMKPSFGDYLQDSGFC